MNDKKVNKKIIESLKKYNQKEKYIFSSIKPDHKSFEEKRYWRGPVWINTNWIIYQSLKNKDKEYEKKIIDLREKARKFRKERNENINNLNNLKILTLKLYKYQNV